jgi:hypothetical protein
MVWPTSLALSGLAYVVLIQILPKINGYAIRQVIEKLSDGAQATRLVKVPNSELAEWDATHDEHGGLRERRPVSDGGSVKKEEL